MQGLGRWCGLEDLEEEGKYLYNGSPVKPIIVLVGNVQVRYVNVVVRGGGVIWDINKNKYLANVNIPILDTFTDYIEEKLRNDGGYKHFGRKGKPLPVLVDNISGWLDLRYQASNDLVPG